MAERRYADACQTEDTRRSRLALKSLQLNGAPADARASLLLVVSRILLGKGLRLARFALCIGSSSVDSSLSVDVCLTRPHRDAGAPDSAPGALQDACVSVQALDGVSRVRGACQHTPQTCL